jgi:hypothetical protein
MTTDTADPPLLELTLGAPTRVLTHYRSMIDKEMWTQKEPIALMRGYVKVLEPEHVRELKALESREFICVSSEIHLKSELMIARSEVNGSIVNTPKLAKENFSRFDFILYRDMLPTDETTYVVKVNDVAV